MAGPWREVLALSVLCALALVSAEGAEGNGAALEARVHQLEGQVEELLKVLDARRLQATTTTSLGPAAEGNPADYIWMLVCGFLVMFMQAGFAMLEVGSVRAQSAQHVLGKNLLDVCIGSVGWYAFGYCLAYGNKESDEYEIFPGKFAGNTSYFGKDFYSTDKNGELRATLHPRDWFFQWAFCSAAATIVSGAVAERVRFSAYLVFTFFMTMIIYPCVVHWTWGGGFLSAKPHETVNGKIEFKDGWINMVGVYDFAGSGIVHMTGGVAALVACILVGPRKGRFEPGNDEEYDPHNVPLVVLGTFILWFGWYGFNCGSTLGLADNQTGAIAAQAAMNTTLSATTSGLIVGLLRFAITGKVDVPGICNGIVAGLVSITGGCANTEAGFAVLIGFLGSLFYQGSSILLKVLHIDDPIDAFPAHGVCGLWGLLAAAFFDWGKDGRFHGGSLGCTTYADDAECSKNAWKAAVGANFALAGMIIAWAGGLTLVILLPFKFLGLLRVDDQTEDAGIDQTDHVPRAAYRIPVPVTFLADEESRRQIRVSRVAAKQ